MFQINVTPTPPLLAITFSGQVDVEQMQECLEQTRARVSDLTPGFIILTDLSTLEVMDPECLPIIKEIMEQCNGYGASAVIRIIPEPDKDIGFSVQTLFHYDKGVTIVTCRSIEEARGFLPEGSADS